LAVEIESELPLIDEGADVWLWPFETDVLPERVSCTSGSVRRYDGDEVMRHLSPTATWVSTPGQLLELYQEGERFWLVDDRWGLCEINVLKGAFRSWVLPRPTLDAARVAELAVLWPMAQLLRHKGLYLLPAVSAARGDFGMLMLCPFNLEGELRALIQAGYEVVGQRWTAVREEGGRIELLRMPGRIEREASPRLRGESSAGAGAGAGPRWVDLTDEYPGVVRHSAFCDAVLVVEPGRRPGAHATELSGQRAGDQLRRAWPITELHPFRRQGQLAMKLAAMSGCWQAQLSRRPEDLLVLLDSLRGSVGARAVRRVRTGQLSAA
jgi:hypothetical protein